MKFFFFLKFKMNFTMFLYVNLEKLAGQEIRYQSKDWSSASSFVIVPDLRDETWL
jgi:hypothetical protein